MLLDIEQIFSLLPQAPYDKADDSNNRKYFEVAVEVMNPLLEVFEEIALLADVTTLFGATLDLRAEEYGIKRGTSSDQEIQGLILAKQNSTVDGNTKESVINFFAQFVPIGDIIIIERFAESLGGIFDGFGVLDGTGFFSGRGFRRQAAFDVQTGAISPELENALRESLQILRAAGVEATVNLLA